MVSQVRSPVGTRLLIPWAHRLLRGGRSGSSHSQRNCMQGATTSRCEVKEPELLQPIYRRASGGALQLGGHLENVSSAFKEADD